MAKMKAFELKKLINEQTNKNLESKDILDFLEKNTGVKKTHSSNLEENEVNLIKNHFLHQAAKPSRTADTKTASQPTTRKSEAEGKPAARIPIAPSTTTAGGSQLGQRPTTVQRPDTVIRQEADRKPVPPKSVGYQGTQGSYHTGSKPEALKRTPLPAGTVAAKTTQTEKPEVSQKGQRPAAVPTQKASQADRTEAAQASQAPQATKPAQPTQSMTKPTQPIQKPTQPTGQTVSRPEQRSESANRNNAQQTYQSHQSNNSGQRQEGHQSSMQQRTQGQDSHSGQRTEGSQRPSDQNQSRQNQGQRYQQGGYQRPSNQNRQGNYNNSQNESGSQQGRYQAGNNQGGSRGQGNGYQGNRSQEGGYQGNRSQGSGYQGNRSQEGGYQGNRSQEGGYQGNRPQGSGYQGNRPQGSGYQGNRPQGSGYQGNRPQGSGYQGNRPQGGGYQAGNRSTGQGGGYPRQGSGTGQRPGGYNNNFRVDEFKKDEDDKPGFGRAGQGAKKGAKGSDRKNFDQQILDQKVAEKNDFSNKRNRDRLNKEKSYKDKGLIEREEFDEDNILKTKLMPKKGQFIQPKPIEVKEEEIKSITVPDIITIKDLADKMKMPASALVKKLFLEGKMVSINQEISYEEAEEIALEYDILVEKEVKVNEVEELLKEEEEDPDTMVKRPPVVCVMGHVDHGKTSLLDAIRATNVTSREAGGITQHIGAYVVEINGEKITFLDTPGHEAFTSMRMRGAKSTDIAILVVAADDGVMPQTVEAISHAKAAGVKIIVAVNKIDKPSANVERVKQELTEYELVAEDWGGETIFVPVSAHTKEGIDQLLEMILLTAEMEELKANPNRNARGIVIEAELDKGRGPVATILVQKGTLKVGDNIVVGPAFGKVRAMMDDKGRKVKDATPSMPVEILGLSEVPEAGETFLVTDTEKEARNIAGAYITQGKEKLIAETKAKLSLDGLFSQIQAGNIKELNLIIKADVQGSVEAMKQSLLKLSNDEVAVRVIHGGVGAINESDVKLASTSNAIVIGFNVKPDNAAKETADREGVDIKFYRVIYNAIDDIENAMKGLLDPVFEERIIGHAEVRQTFKASGIGTIAGSYVTDGKIIRGCKARIYRDNALIFEGTLASLKRFQDDVKEVATGYECGLVFEKFNDIKEGDRVELYNMVEVPR